ncbi:MAG: Nre family DNA repair protein [Candidatus Methanomethylicaceae archaeon]|nr:Nre family DNA repair protein [Candidatus Verstraetearchaeota archaeon]
MNNLCLICRGGKRLCGKIICPIELKARSLIKNLNIKKELYGSSPPSVFVGRIGYPKVYVGPMTPPIVGDTSIMDMPELWINEKLERIVEYRYSLIRGVMNFNINSINNRVITTLQEISLSRTPVDMEMILLKEPLPILKIDENSQIFGPYAPLKSFNIFSIKVDYRLEKAYYDWDLEAREAIFELYKKGVPVSSIQKAFSMGSFGLLKNRRLVPTRWSITAVDSIISKKLINEIKNYESIDKFMLFHRYYMYNNFAAILIPGNWSFEWMEGWFPGTFWNKNSHKPIIMGDYEGYWGRIKYPDIGGCYFATRLAITEYLSKIKRQAIAFVIREIFPEFPLPLGVWFVRENIRAMLNSKPLIFEELSDVLNYLGKIMKIPITEWINNSIILKNMLFQRKINEFN